MVADAGIEPTSVQRMKLVSSARTLIRYNLVEVERIELSTHACKAHVFPLAPHPHGPSSRIRTCDPLVPNQMRYQTALHSDKTGSEGRDRTYDTLINSQVQLPLCYFGITWRLVRESNPYVSLDRRA